jgi:hypothetical protein
MMNKRTVEKHGVSLACVVVLAVARCTSLAAAQHADGHTSRGSEVKSAPSEPAKGNGTLDYPNARPMPLPSLPAPTAPRARPPDRPPGQSGHSPGAPGTLRPKPEVKAPRPPSNPDSAAREPGR